MGGHRECASFVFASGGAWQLSQPGRRPCATIPGGLGANGCAAVRTLPDSCLRSAANGYGCGLGLLATFDAEVEAYNVQGS